MFAIINYLKQFESKITEAEIPELQFLDTELYKSGSFNVNSFVQVIMSKLQDTNYLINQLRLTTEHLNNEIVEQINSNFNNYVVLISKLQAVDFLIDNIDKPLQHIKKRILSEINFLEKYEDELKGVLGYLKENEKQIKIIRLSLKFFKFFNKCKIISKDIDTKYEGTEAINNIISNHPDEYIFKKNNYDFLRKFLVDVLRFFFPVQKLYQIYQLHLKEEVHDHMTSEIRQLEIKYMMCVEDLLRLLMNEFFNNKDKFLFKNLLSLVFQIYVNSNNKSLLFNKILENSLNNEISSIFDSRISNKNIIQRTEELNNLYESKYKVFKEFLNNDLSLTKEFFVSCFVSQLIDRLNNDKFIFNCVDPIIFKDNYNSIINFIGKSTETEVNSEKELVENKAEIQKSYLKIKTFLHSFSFFTYFQYLQNEIAKLFVDDTTGNNNNSTTEESTENFDTILNKSLTNRTNILFNFTKSVRDLFREKKIFLKLIPNFINFLTQCLKFITKKQTELFKDENVTKLLNLINNWNSNESKFSFEEANLTTLKRNITEYINNLNSMVLFFSSESDERNSFFNEMNKVIERESFMFGSVQEFNTMKSKLNNSRSLMQATLINDLNYFIEGSFLNEMLKIEDVTKEIKNKINDNN